METDSDLMACSGSFPGGCPVSDLKRRRRTPPPPPSQVAEGSNDSIESVIMNPCYAGKFTMAYDKWTIAIKWSSKPSGRKVCVCKSIFYSLPGATIDITILKWKVYRKHILIDMIKKHSRKTPLPWCEIQTNHILI